MDRNIRLIATDLDGTLLNTRKEFTQRTIDAIRRAVANGVVFVPATGRAVSVVPDYIKGHDFVRHIITLNGARSIDLEKGRDIAVNEIDPQTALAVMETLDGLPVYYECCFANKNRMGAAHHARVTEFALDEDTLTMVRREREPVPDLKQAVKNYGGSVQKIQFYVTDPAEKPRYMARMRALFPGLSVASSTINNIEITHKKANKGDAVLLLCSYLGIDPAQAMTFGDGLNDIPMLRAAGIGVAMANAEPDVFAAADRVAPSCDEEGVARVIEELCL